MARITLQMYYYIHKSYTKGVSINILLYQKGTDFQQDFKMFKE